MLTWMMFWLRLAAHFPIALLHAFGVALGWIVYWSSPRFRRHARENLAQAGLRGGALRRSVVAHSGKAVMEIPAIWLRPHDSVQRLVREVSGWEYVERAAAKGSGIILLTPHLGCWEVAAQFVSWRMPLTVLYSPPKVEPLERVMLAGRSREMLTSVPADLRGVRSLMKALKRGEAVGMLPDQVPDVGEGEWAEFFGRPAYTMTLVARLSERTGAPVFMGYAERLAWGRGYRVIVEPMLAVRPPESPVRALNRSLEHLIRRCPEQYLWAYNRYKQPAGTPPPGRA